MHILVHNELEINLDELPDHLIPEIIENCTYRNPEYFKAKAMGYYPKCDKTISNYTLDRQSKRMLIPRGKMADLREILSAFEIPYKCIDQRISNKMDIDLNYDSSIELWEDQQDLLDTILKKENVLVRGGCGIGKTEIAIKFIDISRENTLVVVWSDDLYVQWIERLADRFNLKKSEIGEIKGSKEKIKPITVALNKTLYNRLQKPKFKKEVSNYFGAVICDEVQRFAANTFYGAVSPFTAKYRIGVSEDETRKDGKEFLVYDLFGRVAHEVSIDELENKGIVHRVPIYVVPTELRDEEYENPPLLCRYCKKEYDPMTIVKEDVAPYNERYLMKGDPCLNVRRGKPCRGNLVINKDYNGVLNTIIDNDDRHKLIIKIAKEEVEEGNTLVVFSDRIPMCEKVSEMFSDAGIPNGIVSADTKYKKMRKDVIKDAKIGKIKALIGTSTIYQGLDVPRLNRGIVTIPKATNYQQLSQQLGRLRRPERFCGICSKKIEQTHEDVANYTVPMKCPHCGVNHKYDAKLYYIWDQYVFPKHLALLDKHFKSVYVYQDGVYITVKEYFKKNKR